ncbi:glucose 1-dehydrogenase [Chryseobacterium caseinilyticum]|uniref:Glucose 1-dehydrogenase n=1 Tax=Chryseobacterium caseinilyticum TaxID=2771428 RepID=A0ABR8ZAY9_9FLAO|nr:glucose 1-dehydrogenase [Chryseobacterium caseinilyticum]MBD8082417.1 glucose 1-dehydrogenase [Chryseobacterium caseinilyticum]
MQISLKNQIAIVTGASSGIGTGIAKSLAAAGAKVVINHSSERSKDEAEDILKEIQNVGGEGMIFQCDVSKEDEVKAMFEKTISEYGTVDILVNNAGLQKDAEFTEMTVEDWDTVMNVNLRGQFLCAREAIKEFLRRGIDLSKSVACGKIIHISSVHEVIPWAGHVNYAASKGGVKLLMQSLAQEYGAKKIRINSICPGAIQTPINEEAWGTEEAMDDLLKLIPYDRIGQPEDVGNLAVFLASDFADYITGASIFVDGGMTVLESFSKGG